LPLLIFGKQYFHWLGNVAVPSVVMAPMVLELAAIKPPPLESRVLLLLGDASYALYLLHVPLWLLWDHITRINPRLRLDRQLTFRFTPWSPSSAQLSFC
jgi:peptidoglycan/LPS O-acetylase OafA/YrhL